MKDLTAEQIREIYMKLPQDLKEAILGVDSTETMRKIGEKQKLAIDKIGKMVGEAGYVMLGVTHPNEFIANLAERLDVDKEKARAIAQEINEQIFKKVRESLRKIHNMREEGEERNVGHSVSNITNIGRSDILKEIEKDHTKEKENDIPEIMKGSANPFEEKMKEGVLIAPVEEKHYTEEKPKNYKGIDPYREPVE